MSAVAVDSPIAAIEVAANVSLTGGDVGIIAIRRDRRGPGGWVHMTPNEARHLADALCRAAIEAEATS